MAAITVNVPTLEEDELIKRFMVNKNYLQALRGFLIDTYGKSDSIYRGLRTVVVAHHPYIKIKRRPGADLDEVRRYLLLAWTSEIQLHLPELMGVDAMVGYANAWAPVHAYYAVYGALQAWFAADGQAGNADDHSSALAVIANQVSQRNLFPAPWNLLAEGCPMRKNATTYRNAPWGVNLAEKVEPLSVPNPFGADPSFWSRYAMWLRTTREARLTLREAKWKKENGKQNISTKARTHFASSLSPTSIFDCFFRLRIKSNYGTIDPYLVKHITSGDHAVFNNALCAVTRSTIGLFELYIMRRIGQVEYARIANDFVAQDISQLSARTLQPRLKAYGI